MARHIPSDRLFLSEGSQVEISSKNNGIEGVWYKAIIETKPVSEQLCVRFLKGDFSNPLEELENDDSVMIRPVPPKNLLDHIVIEVGTIVDADYKDAWWTGFVVEKIKDDECLVFFDSLSDIIQFDIKHLRPHLQWGDEKMYSWWAFISTQNSELASEPTFCPGRMVEVSYKINEAEVVWVFAMFIKKFKDDDDDEYKYIVKLYDKPLSFKSNEARPKITVDLRRLRPTQPYIRVEEYQWEDCVEVFDDDMGWRQGRVVGRGGGAMGIQKWYVVRFEATNNQLMFKETELRPLKVWEDGVWKTLTQGSEDETGDSVMDENESDPSVTSPPGFPAKPSKQIVAKAQGKTFPKKSLPRNQNCSGNNSTRENETSKDITRKRNREENLCSDASVKDRKANDTTMTLPFEKKLRIWKKLESLEVSKAVPQSPHFSPLVGTREDCREMLAVGMMLTFFCLLEEVKALQHDDSISSLKSLSNSFAELEKHGFNMKVPKLRISKLLSLKDRQARKMEELKSAEKKTAEKESIKVENERKIIALQRLNEETDKEIEQSKSCAATIAQQLKDVELQFQATASAPW